ncbi:MAG: NAD-dependent epimerase/dehydratase family protein [Acidobacteriaceae bacterium]
MHILLIGASGMVGQAALLACQRDDRITQITALVRHPLGTTTSKVREILCPDLFAISTIADQLGSPDACLFCAGVSSVGMSEPQYRHVTYDLTIAVAEVLSTLNPSMRFLYVSGAGTDSTERGRSMWARVKGATENALCRLPFAAVALFRPGYIQPLHGVSSKVGWYNAIYTAISPLYPLIQRVVPKYAADTDTLGRAMIAAVQPGTPTAVYESVDINRIGA